MRDDFLVFGAPLIEQDEIDEVIDCLRSGWLGTGPKTSAFERAFCEYRSAEYAVAVSSCTAALHLSMLAAGVGPGDEVITTPMTFCATVNAIIHTGATPVLADCEPDTYCIDPDKIAEALTKRTKAIIPVHFAGMPCDMNRIMDLAEMRGLKVIEDCAHAIETEYAGQPVGTFGDFGCFSFYVTKNLVTGEGGMVLAADKSNADRIKMLALHGMSADAWQRFSDSGYKHYQVVTPGFKYNMMDIQAALGIHQLKRIEQNWLRRREIWDIYNQLLADLPLTLPPEADSMHRHGRHLYTILVENAKTGCTRDSFIEQLTAMNIGVGVHYRSIPSHPYYRQTYGWRPEDWPVSQRIGDATVSLPLSPALTESDVNDVAAAVKSVISGDMNS